MSKCISVFTLFLIALTFPLCSEANASAELFLDICADDASLKKKTVNIIQNQLNRKPLLHTTYSEKKKQIAVVLQNFKKDKPFKEVAVCGQHGQIKLLKKKFPYETELQSLKTITFKDSKFVYFLAQDKNREFIYYWDVENNKLYFVSGDSLYYREKDDYGNISDYVTYYDRDSYVFSQNIVKDTPIYEITKGRHELRKRIKKFISTESNMDISETVLKQKIVDGKKIVVAYDLFDAYKIIIAEELENNVKLLNIINVIEISDEKAPSHYEKIIFQDVAPPSGEELLLYGLHDHGQSGSDTRLTVYINPLLPHKIKNVFESILESETYVHESTFNGMKVSESFETEVTIDFLGRYNNFKINKSVLEKNIDGNMMIIQTDRDIIYGWSDKKMHYVVLQETKK